MEFSLEMLSCCPFRQHPWHVPSSHRVGQPAPFPLSRALPSCELTRALLESTAAEPEVQSSPLSSTPKNTLPARILAASHPRAQVLAAAGHTRGWGIAGSGWDGVSWEPALPPRIDYREGLKFGESSLATVTVCAVLREKSGQRKICAGKTGVEKRGTKMRWEQVPDGAQDKATSPEGRAQPGPSSWMTNETHFQGGLGSGPPHPKGDIPFPRAASTSEGFHSHPPSRLPSLSPAVLSPRGFSIPWGAAGSGEPPKRCSGVQHCHLTVPSQLPPNKPFGGHTTHRGQFIFPLKK